MIAEEATANEVRLRENAKVGDQVRRAAVFLRYNDAAQADRLLDGLPAEQVPRSLEAADTFMAVANWNLRQERLRTAAQRFNILGRVLTSVDMRATRNASPSTSSLSPSPCAFRASRASTTNSASSRSSACQIRKPHRRRARPEGDAAQARRSRDPPKNFSPRAYVLRSLGQQDGPEARTSWRGSNSPSPSSPSAAATSKPAPTSRGAALELASTQRAAHRLRQAPPRHASTSSVAKPKAPRQTIAALRDEVDRWLQGPFQFMNSDGTLWYNQQAVLVLLQEAESMLAKQDQ